MRTSSVRSSGIRSGTEEFLPWSVGKTGSNARSDSVLFLTLVISTDNILAIKLLVIPTDNLASVQARETGRVLMRDYKQFLNDLTGLPPEASVSDASRAKAMLAMLLLALDTNREKHGEAAGKTLGEVCNGLVSGYFSENESQLAGHPVTEEDLDAIRRAVSEDCSGGMSECELVAAAAGQLMPVPRADDPRLWQPELVRAMRKWAEESSRVIQTNDGVLGEHASIVGIHLPFAWKEERPRDRDRVADLYAKCLRNAPGASGLLSPKLRFLDDINDTRTGLVFFGNGLSRGREPMFVLIRCRAAVLINASFKQSAFRDQAVLDTLVKTGRLYAIIDIPQFFMPLQSGPFSLLLIAPAGERNSSVRMVSLEDPSLAGDVIPGTGGLGRRFSEKGAKLLQAVAERAPLDPAHEAAVPSESLYGADIGAFQTSRYVMSGSERQSVERVGRFGRRLGDIARIIRPLPLRRPGAGSAGREFLEANAADINELGFIERPRKRVTLAEKTTKGFEQTRLVPGDIVLFIKGQLGVCGLVSENADGNWIFSQSAVLIRLKRGADGIIASTLLRYLRSEDVQAYLRCKCAMPGTVPYMLVGAVAEIPVPNLDDMRLTSDWHVFEEQKRLWKRIEELRGELHGMDITTIPDTWT